MFALPHASTVSEGWKFGPSSHSTRNEGAVDKASLEPAHWRLTVQKPSLVNSDCCVHLDLTLSQALFVAPCFPGFAGVLFLLTWITANCPSPLP